MEVTSLLSTDTICLRLHGHTKSEILDELIEVLTKAGKLTDPKAFKEAILKREAEFPTGLEKGIAIPHARTDAVRSPAIALGIAPNGVEYGSLDNQPSRIFFLIAETEAVAEEHLEILAALTRHMQESNYIQSLLQAGSANELIRLLADEAQAGNAVEAGADATGPAAAAAPPMPRVLAVTGCPTGIAHTYMAADALKVCAERMELPIRVETRGAIGERDRLTEQEIAAAEVIVIASDTRVDMNRFAGKKLIRVPVGDAIHDPKGLLERALSGEAAVYTGEGDAAAPRPAATRPGIYQHLMNGVSNMLPFVVGGGILIALSLMFGVDAFDPDSPNYHPLAAALMTLGGSEGAFGLMIPVLAAFIGMSIADRPGFMPAMVGGWMAVHSGGGFIGGMIAGLLGGYLMLAVSHLCRNLPRSLQGVETVLIYPVIGLLLTGGIMYLLLMPLADINSALVNWLGSLGIGNLILLGTLLGGLMAVDLGGPVNKAAYTFGIAAIAAGNHLPQAAVMAGGMVPPLAMGLATLLFRSRFGANERRAGKSCFVLGASFITEGAIPFAAADPLRVLPACIVGSALAGGLSMYFGCQLPAPHGGVFVIPLVQHPFLYLLAIACGSLLSALLVGSLKPPLAVEARVKPPHSSGS
ncbi:fructose-specific PTS transporter subunit EIIC [Halomonas sp. EGI 63088]|uniref:Fructose-specific PTS transporter subunit EIIC n=1 Tax=Halomonas flagellata TaxID=2920385 RepID=A0ABS9RNI4_9GAMM|nr:fructose-specific PTS transporter subunit EIIC [Halomonas flagellata]MCH4561541.1 fructose-specific PTS transporter subunit EIIC [Halomonas flagellata]